MPPLFLRRAGARPHGPYLEIDDDNEGEQFDYERHRPENTHDTATWNNYTSDECMLYSIPCYPLFLPRILPIKTSASNHPLPRASSPPPLERPMNPPASTRPTNLASTRPTNPPPARPAHPPASANARPTNPPPAEAGAPTCHYQEPAACEASVPTYRCEASARRSLRGPRTRRLRDQRTRRLRDRRTRQRIGFIYMMTMKKMAPKSHGGRGESRKQAKKNVGNEQGEFFDLDGQTGDADAVDDAADDDGDDKLGFYHGEHKKLGYTSDNLHATIPTEHRSLSFERRSNEMGGKVGSRLLAQVAFGINYKGMSTIS